MQTKRLWKFAVCAGLTASALLVASALLIATPSLAKRWRNAPDASYPHITVMSEQGGWATISAPVRPGRYGAEVRLPGGAWVRCGINCYHTLRNQTIDFWRRYDAPPR